MTDEPLPPPEGPTELRAEAPGQSLMFDLDAVASAATPEQQGAPCQMIKVHFRNREDRQAFAEMLGQPITDDTQALWHPKPKLEVWT